MQCLFLSQSMCFGFLDLQNIGLDIRNVLLDGKLYILPGKIYFLKVRLLININD